MRQNSDLRLAAALVRGQATPRHYVLGSGQLRLTRIETVDSPLAALAVEE